MKFLASILFSLILLNSCEYGCTDPGATNYNTFAEKENGSCTYLIKLGFWYKFPTYTNLNGAGANQINFYVNGKLEAVRMNSIYSVIPFPYDCSDSTVTWVEYTTMGDSTTNYLVEAKTNNNIILYQNTINQADKDNCTLIELEY